MLHSLSRGNQSRIQDGPFILLNSLAAFLNDAFHPHALLAFWAFSQALEDLFEPGHIALVRAIFAGWLIALMVWLLPGAESARVSIIIILTYLVGLGGFNHIVAGSTTVFFMVANNYVSWATYFKQFFLPTLLGNIIGGVTLVAALAHAQVVGGRSDS